ncbi:16S rRNA (uracil(1498)-N(3))-methyltransferase [bacterium]|nr:16S rRNA (uracil(1498)-N(3))-methyltransferase [bacterium]
MQRYFSKKIENNRFTLTEEDTYHITKVMRMVKDDKIEVVYQENTYICKIVSLSPLVEAEIVEEIKNNQELKTQVTIVQSLVKEQKMDYILQKTVELGVDKIIPYCASRSVIKINEKKDKKIERWKSILKEAAEQSKRIKIPEITNPINLSNLVKLSDYDIKFLCTVNESSQNLKKVLSNMVSGVKILFVIGPEGGFTPEEEKVMMENGFLSVSLGNSVLRTETASTFIMSVVRYIDME